ncbi:uncharacterized protein LOC110851020 isoform X2 [Folsomia candida]|uniref:uncharacterized protein LOC110851020 isoform X2 n=1 Tax=Folsomia candida TaxID=158441 RepID=UPI0016051186|nr:uncharacterized protein LOC110851020 isoform X2 [Folsomia candida]
MSSTEPCCSSTLRETKQTKSCYQSTSPTDNDLSCSMTSSVDIGEMTGMTSAEKMDKLMAYGRKQDERADRIKKAQRFSRSHQPSTMPKPGGRDGDGAYQPRPDSRNNNNKEDLLAGCSVLSSDDATIIRDSIIPEDGAECANISGILQYCKRRILYPYFKLLGVMGLKPWNADSHDDMCAVSRVLNKLWVVVVVLMLIVGYTLQFITCFRRDYGFDYEPVFRGHHLRDPEHVGSFNNNASNLMEIMTTPKPFGVDPNFTDIEEIALKRELLFHSICTGNSFYVHLIPSILHVTAFGYMLCLYWFNYDEQLQTLMERVFIHATQAHCVSFSQKRVVKTLKFLVFFGAVWLICSVSCVVLQVLFSEIRVNFWPSIKEKQTIILASVMGFSAVWQDAVQITVIISYCIHCHLLSIFLDFIHNRISQHSITLLECIKEIGEIDKLLRYLNKELACGLLPLVILDTMFSIGSVTFLLGRKPGAKPYAILTAWCSCAQWVLLVILPLWQGAKLSSSLKKARELGHLVRMRPFGYQNYDQQDLDSFLLFVSTLKMDVRVMKLPLTSTNISLLFFLVAIAIFMWGYFQ